MKSTFKISFPILLLFFSAQTFGYTVKDIVATYRNGQVFITWTCPASTNLKYKVYRSLTKFTDTSQLNSNTYIGNVRDSSSKNIRLSEELNKNLFFRIDNNAASLASTQGVYVFTCIDNQKWFYAVMVEKLSNHTEQKKINAGKNSLKKSVQESVFDPQPVFQDSAIWNTSNHAMYYAWFVNNVDAPNFPAMCSEGSYGFNFYLVKRGNATKFPLFAFYEGLLENSLKGNGIDSFKNVDDCYILGFDDWIPTPNANHSGENTFWFGYHEDYDMYHDDNPIPTSGVVKPYTQNRYVQSILWARKYLPIDTTKVYTVGVSAGGMGAYLTGNLIPEKITAVYCVVGDFIVITLDNPDTQPEQMWGDTITNLPTNILNPETGDAIPIFTVFDNRKLVHITKNQNLPLFYSVYGKNDFTIPWTPLTIAFIDSLQNNLIGGNFYWDQRAHNGAGKNFNDDETMPDWFSLSTTTAYPAFSNCTIDQDPGDGIPSNGASYGAINGYLDYTRDNVTDQSCKLTFRTSLVDLYVGGNLDPNQYTTCFADVTIRRAQSFHPTVGQTIKWNNFDNTNAKIQTGSFTYNGGLVTIPGVQINKTGCRLDVKILNCNRETEPSEIIAPEIILLRTNNGYTVKIVSAFSDKVSLSFVNILGQIVLNKTVSIEAGEAEIPVSIEEDGVYILNLKGASFSESKKMFLSR